MASSSLQDITRENLVSRRLAEDKLDRQQIEHRRNHHREVWYETKERQLCVTGWLRKNYTISLPSGIPQIINEFRGPLFKWLKSTTDYRFIHIDDDYWTSTDNAAEMIPMCYAWFNVYSMYSYNSIDGVYKFKIRSPTNGKVATSNSVRIWIGFVPTQCAHIKGKPFFCFYDNSYGYASNGELHFCRNENQYVEQPFGEGYDQGDAIMVIMEFDKLQCSFYKNGVKQGDVKIVKGLDYKIAVCLREWDNVISYMP